MPLPPNSRACLTCGNMLRGRMDKKFCDDYCRSAYNNKHYSQDGGFVRKVNTILRKNRRILEEAVPVGEEVSRVHKARLMKKGFNFSYLTSAYSNKQGTVYYFCYEYGYMLMENDWYYIIRRKEIIGSRVQ